MKSLLVLTLFALNCVAQNNPLLSKVSTTPPDVLQVFMDAGMSPTEHPLTKEERRIVSKAFDALPPLHQRVLSQHLKSISFLDNMPNTAFTSPIAGDSTGYHVAFRAGILHQTISEWATEKERTCFAGGDTTITVSIEAGFMSAFTYVLLHEGTHVVDGSLHLLPTADFAKNVWKNINTHEWTVTDSIMLRSRFRPGGAPFPYSDAPRVYTALSQSPFMSLYSTASWHEDLAEMLTIYHLTHILRQPYSVVVKQRGQVICRFTPGPKERVGSLQRFYASSLGGSTFTSFSSSFCTTCTA